MSEPTTTTHKAAALTAASALAMWDAAQSGPDQRRAGAAMADLLRRKGHLIDQKTASVKTKPAKVDDRTLSAETLGLTLRRMMGIVNDKAPMPPLRNVYLEASDGGLRIVGTDLDMIYEERLEAPNLEPFVATVPVKGLALALRGAKGEVKLTVVYGGQNLKVEAADGTVTYLNALEGATFPFMILPETKPTGGVMPVAELLGALEFVSPAISAEETRYYLNGVYMHDEGGLTFVATDGSRLLRDRLPTSPLTFAPATENRKDGAIIPRAAITWMLKNLKGAEVKVDIWESKMRLTTQTGVFTTNLIDGSFPQYQRVIPRDDDSRSGLGVDDAKAFAAALRKAGAMTGTKSACVVLESCDGAVSAAGRNLGGNRVDVPLSCAAVGDKIDVAVNANLLAEMIDDRGPFTIGFAGPNDPGLILWPEHTGRCGVIMPMRNV